MPEVDAIEKGEVRVTEFEIGRGTHYSVCPKAPDQKDCRPAEKHNRRRQKRNNGQSDFQSSVALPLILIHAGI